MSSVEASVEVSEVGPDWYALHMVRERAGEELPT